MRFSRLLVVWVPICVSVPALVLSALYGAECENRKAKSNPCPAPVTVTTCAGSIGTQATPCAQRKAQVKRTGLFECLSVSGSNTNCVVEEEPHPSGVGTRIVTQVCYDEAGCMLDTDKQTCIQNDQNITQHRREVYKNENCGAGNDEQTGK